MKMRVRLHVQECMYVSLYIAGMCNEVRKDREHV